MIETKYNVDDIVFYMFENKCHNNIVSHIKIDINKISTKIVYGLNNGKVIHENELFISKEELLNSL